MPQNCWNAIPFPPEVRDHTKAEAAKGRLCLFFHMFKIEPVKFIIVMIRDFGKLKGHQNAGIFNSNKMQRFGADAAANQAIGHPVVIATYSSHQLRGKFAITGDFPVEWKDCPGNDTMNRGTESELDVPRAD